MAEELERVRATSKAANKMLFDIGGLERAGPR